MVDTADIPTILSLLTRAAKAFEERDRSQSLLQQAQKDLEDANKQISNVQAAFALFDLPVGQPETWGTIQKIVGADAYKAAVQKGVEMVNASRLPSKPLPPIPPLPSTSKQEEAEEEDFEEIDAGDAGQAMLFEGSTPDRPSIRELALDRLRSAGAAGTKARAIREYIESTYKIRLHYKTVGMTLYRLSQDGLARREGQTWFIVPETMNPGGDTPGLQSLLR